MKKPMISVVMPIYNGEKYLKEAIDSILGQSFTDFELIIINDASKDASEELILSYKDDRINYIKNPVNLGLIGSLNLGIDIAKGKYIARMDQDDVSKLNRFQLQYDFMEHNPDCILLGGQADIINSKHKLEYPIKDEAIRAKLIFSPSFVHPTVMIRKSMLDNNNLKYSETYKHAEDYGFWVNLAKYGKLANLPQTCLNYRRHEGQYTIVFNQEMFQMVKKIQLEYLKNNNIILTDNDLNFLDLITERRINYSDKSQVKEIGAFLSQLPCRFKNSPISEKAVKELTSIIWNKTCNNRLKKGFSTYKIYISNSLAFYKFNIKKHLYFLKKGF